MSKSVTCILHEWFSHMKPTCFFLLKQSRQEHLSTELTNYDLYMISNVYGTNICYVEIIYKGDKAFRHSLCVFDLSASMICQKNKSNTTGATCGAGATYHN